MISQSSYHDLLSAISPAQLVAVSKLQPAEKIQALYDYGHRDFGENRVQNLMGRKEAMPDDIRWHLLGPLQSNKVKYVVPFVHLIHSVDRWSIWQQIHKQAHKIDRIVSVLLQVKISPEPTKSGFDPDDLELILQQRPWQALTHVRLRGVMGMASFTSDESIIENEFMQLQKIFYDLKANHFQESQFFTELSMGMTSDYRVALKHGSTMVRIGSGIFGERQY